MRRIVLLFLLICTACGAVQNSPPPGPVAGAPPAQAPAPANACHIGPDDGPVLLAERGIGGTGLPQLKTPAPVGGGVPAAPAGQNRGIGGTGTKAAGNTGIVGEITGFASVCLNGVEVAYDPATAINIDGAAGSPGALRVGQIAAITASPDADAKDGLLAMKLAIRHEVSGPVSAVQPGLLTVAGQQVKLNAATRGLHDFTPGAWVAVSGFRNNHDVIVATRIDPQVPGPVIVHGKLIRKAQKFWIGGLQLDVAPGTPALRNGAAVTATGTLDGAVLNAATLQPDLLYSDPRAYFGPSVTRILMQSYVYTLGSAVHIAIGGSLGILSGVKLYNRPGLALLTLVELPGTSLLVVGQLFGLVDGAYNPFQH